MNIDLNCDLGEGCSGDAELMPLITSANICCGSHAGDAATSLASYLCTVRRLEEALAWAERAVAASAGDPATRLRALIIVALSLTLAGRGPEGLARLGELPAGCPGCAGK